jgi:hypothetical protein
MLNFLVIVLLIGIALSNPLGFARSALLVIVLTVIIWSILYWVGYLHI